MMLAPGTAKHWHQIGTASCHSVIRQRSSVLVGAAAAATGYSFWMSKRSNHIATLALEEANRQHVVLVVMGLSRLDFSLHRRRVKVIHFPLLLDRSIRIIGILVK